MSGCDCNDIELITYVDEETREILISHGVCRACLRNIPMPQISVREYRAALSAAERVNK